MVVVLLLLLLLQLSSSSLLWLLSSVPLLMIFVLSFAVVHLSLHNRNPVTYESVSTAIFREGRTDTIRSCTMETDAFVSAMEDTQRTVS